MPTAAAAAAAEPRVDATNDATTAAAMGNASTPNAGSTAATANALGALGGGKNLSVLLVEDDHSTLVFVKAMLRSCGHSVTTATNGQEAIDALLDPSSAIDLVLTDIMMPEVDGLELMKIVQSSDKPFRSIPIIVMSTVDSDEFQAKCTEAGAQDYLVKPVKKAQMADLARHTVGGGAGMSVDRIHSNNSGASTETAQGRRGPSPDGQDATTATPSTRVAAEAAAVERAENDKATAADEVGRGKRSSRLAGKKAQDALAAKEAEEAAKELKASTQAKAQGKARAAAKAATSAKAAKPQKGGEGKQGQSGAGHGAGSGSGCDSGSGSGANEKDDDVAPEPEGLSVQLAKAYGGATTMLEIALPKGTAPPEEAPKVGLRRSASRSAFQSFLNLEEAAEAQIVKVKVDPDVGGDLLANLAGVAAAEGEKKEPPTAAVGFAPPAFPGAPNAFPGMFPGMPPQMAAFFGMPPNPAAAAAAAAATGMPMPPGGFPGLGAFPGATGVPQAPPRNVEDASTPPQPAMNAMPMPGGFHPGAFPPCPPGVDPTLYAQHMAAAAAAMVPPPGMGAMPGPGGGRDVPGGMDFMNRFYAVLQGAVEHQQKTFARLGASATCAERRAEAIARFLKKRKERNFDKKVRYASRKRLAEARPRVKGQFVRLKSEGDAGGEGDKNNSSGGEGSAGDDGSGEGSNGGGSSGASKENSASPTRETEQKLVQA